MTRPPLRLSQFGLINTYLVPEDDGFTLIDAGLPGLERRVLATVRRTGVANGSQDRPRNVRPRVSTVVAASASKATMPE